MKTLPLSLATALLLLGSHAAAAVRLPAIFSDGMVLQQGADAPIWGWADAGEKITVSFADQEVSTEAAADGRWEVKLDPLAVSATARPLTVKGSNTLTLKDVLVGEVWICSGQSNMQWTVAQAANAEQEIAAAKLPSLRMFSLDRVTADTPATDCKGRWLPATPENVGAFSAVAFYFGRHLHQVLNVPIGLINTSWGGTRVEAWTSMDALKQRPSASKMIADWNQQIASWNGKEMQAAFEKRRSDWQQQVKKIQAANQKLAAGKPKAPIPAAPRPPEDPAKSQHRPAALYNAMIAPLIPYAVQGAIWYQGESNQKRAFQYQELLPTLINDWRQRWGRDFSFYIVQLAAFGNRNPDVIEPGYDDTWAELQEAQLLTALTLPDCGLAVTNDIGEKDNIHPKNKQEVGRRLALWALANDYDKADTVRSGPLFKNATLRDGKVHIDFQYADSGLKTRDGGELKQFQIAGADGKWVWAKAVIEGSSVIVSSPDVPQPVGVRYAWMSWPEGANLVNLEGLPASCFRTDPFPPMTLGVTSPYDEAPETRRKAP
ncbi:MAG: hypothetical protein KDK99_03880 [Verrucomicrobiales bacterium]|nr:hypothetical protein [Verrucomicrobiales bacterium]